MLTPRFRTLASTLAVVMLAACSGESPNEPTPGTLTVTAPTSVPAGGEFQLSVSAEGNVGSLVELSASAGSITPPTLSLSGGSGTVTVQLSAGSGAIQITATAGATTGETTVTITPLAIIPGNPGDNAADNIPFLEYTPVEEDYSDDHPDLAGLPLSHNQVMVVFEPGTTVGQVNALLASSIATISGCIPGSGSVSGILIIRLTTSTHTELETALTTLRSDPIVTVAAQDVLLAEASVPNYNNGVPADWVYETTPGGGNWGLERTRVPQMWNLNDALDKNGADTFTGVFDNGVLIRHEDISIDAYHGNIENCVQYTNSRGQQVNTCDHGTHVTGIIAAKFSNGKGIDGINPFASIVFTAFTPIYGNVLQNRAAMGQAIITGAFGLLNAYPNIRVLNTSLGYNWGSTAGQTTSEINPMNHAGARVLIVAHGALVKAAMDVFSGFGSVPLWVTAAGNDSNDFGAPIEAVWGSPMTNAALNYGVENIIVVEAVSNTPAVDPSGATRADFSNLNGHISAPGVGIRSSVALPSKYDLMDGTSMASPHIAGLAGYLLALDPSLTATQVKSIMTSSAVAGVGDRAKKRMDAFGAAMEIDAFRGNDRVLRMLCDIDDGGIDGNIRENADGTENTDEDIDSDGGMGDGEIDMSDFRRWRDWLLFIESKEGLVLDGDPQHIKMDANRDGKTHAANKEKIYPRGDFNGDGITDRESFVRVGGAVVADATDLEVLQIVFDDPDYYAAELDNLINSGDLHANPKDCFVSGVSYVETMVFSPGGALVEKRLHQDEDDERVITVPAVAGEYRIVADARDAAHNTLALVETAKSFAPGEDFHWSPDCSVPVVDSLILQVEYEEVVSRGAGYRQDLAASVTVYARWRSPDGATRPAPGIELRVDGENIERWEWPAPWDEDPITDGGGKWEGIYAIDDVATTGVLRIRATNPDPDNYLVVEEAFPVTADTRGTILGRRWGWIRAHVHYAVPGSGTERDDAEYPKDETDQPVFGAWNDALSVEGSGSDEATYSGSSNLTFSDNMSGDAPAHEITGYNGTITSNAQVNYDRGTCGDDCRGNAGTDAEVNLYLFVFDRDVPATIIVNTPGGDGVGAVCSLRYSPFDTTLPQEVLFERRITLEEPTLAINESITLKKAGLYHLRIDCGASVGYSDYDDGSDSVNSTTTFSVTLSP